MTRRLSVERLQEGNGWGLGLGTDEPRTAVTRLRGTRMSYVSWESGEGGSDRRLVRVAPMIVPAGLGAPVDRLEFLETAPGSHCHAGERALSQVDRHLGLVAEALVEVRQQGPAPGEDDSPVHDVGGQFRRGLVEGGLDRLDDLLHRLVQGPPDLLGAADARLPQSGEHAAPADLRLPLFAHVVGGADLKLDLFAALLADPALVIALG